MLPALWGLDAGATERYWKGGAAVNVLCALGFGAGGAAGCRCKVLLLECCARFGDWAPGRQHCICAGAAAGCCCPGAAVRMLRALWTLGVRASAAAVRMLPLQGAACCRMLYALRSLNATAHCWVLPLQGAGARCCCRCAACALELGSAAKCFVL